MKLNHLSWLTRNEDETITTFGEARLVKKLDGKIDLVGGSPENRIAAKEWLSLFLHEAVVSVVSERQTRSHPL